MNNDPGFPLYADGLTSKWGFGDGDSLHDYVWDICYELEIDPPDRDDFLELMVRTYLLPELDKRGVTYKIEKIGTNHNPIRAYEINGEDVSDHHYDSSYEHPIIGNIEVWIPKSEIVKHLTGDL